LQVALTGTGPWSVTWSDNPSQPQTISTSPAVKTVAPSVTTNYSITAVDANNCSAVVSGSPVTITVKPPAPFNVLATAATTTQVNVTWSFSGSADRFDIYRSGTANAIGSSAGTVFSFSDTGAAPSTAYVYTVKAVKANTASDSSSGDLATTVLFTDDPLVSQVTVVKAVHVTQLQTAVNAVRVAAGLSPQSFPGITPGTTLIYASHIEGLRTALAPARAALGLAPAAYTRSPLTAGMMVFASDVNDTRGGVR